RARGLIALGLVAACASTSTRTSTSTSAAATAPDPSRSVGTPPMYEGSQTPGFEPAGKGAAKYATTAGADGRGPVPADDLRRSLLGEVRAAARKQGHKPPEVDARLDWAMTDLARQVRDDDLPALDVVDFLLAHYGLVEPSPHILLSSVPLRGAAELSAHARGEIAEMMRGESINRAGLGIDRTADTLY